MNPIVPLSGSCRALCDRMIDEDDFDLKQMSDLKLAQFKQGMREDNPRAVLVEKEFERRAREEQHKLDLKLIAEQVRWMKFSVVAVIAAAVIAALLTYFLSNTTEQKYRHLMQEMSKRQAIESPLPSVSETIQDHPRQKASDDKSTSGENPSSKSPKEEQK